MLSQLPSETFGTIVHQIPAFAQARMEEMLRDIPEVNVYIDDIGIFTNSWERHVEVVDEVMRELEERSFTVNLLKCEWAVKETN